MTRLRRFADTRLIAAAIVALVLIALTVWKVGQSLGPTAAPAATAPSATRPATAPHGSSTTAPAAQTPSRATPAGQPETGRPAGSTAAARTAAMTSNPSSPPPPGTGRADPFSPLVSPGAAATGPATATGGGTALPPIPPLSPLAAIGPRASSTPGSGGPAAADAARPRGQLRLTGIVDGPTAMAILTDGAGSYVVQPGDAIPSGVRLLTVDAMNSSVTLAWNNQSWQLHLGGGTTQ